MAETKRCAHTACNCVAPADGKYCSQYCDDAGNTEELACNCGHPGCAEELTHRG
jgi:metallothionein